MDRLTQDFANSLIVSAEDGIKDCIELGIDSFIKDGTLKEFPIVSNIVSGFKFAKNIYDRNLLKKTLTFIDELNKGTLSRDELIAYQSTILNNPKRCEDELGRVMIYLNSFIDDEKSIMLAKLYKAYIKELIKWDEFCEYAEITNRIFIQDLKILKDIYNKVIVDDTGPNKFRIERLYSTGLVGWNPKVMFSFGEQEITENKVNISSLGKKFVEIVF